MVVANQALHEVRGPGVILIHSTLGKTVAGMEAGKIVDLNFSSFDKM